MLLLLPLHMAWVPDSHWPMAWYSLVHTGAQIWPAEQLLPQVLQLLKSLVPSVHVLAQHSGRLPEHLKPHIPQLLGSELVSTVLPPQLVCVLWSWFV
jgi:hypothetical protein